MTDTIIMTAEPLNCMLDLETMGRRPFAPVLSIGACVFHMGEPPSTEPPSGITDVFYQAITLESCLSLGMRIDADTLDWWMGNQDSSPSPEARHALFCDPKAVTLPIALDAFTEWVHSRPLKMWGNSARFDLGLLEAAYSACGKTETSWHFRNERCYRTIKSIPAARDIELHRYGTFHNALDDAISQALHLREINQRLNLQL